MLGVGVGGLGANYCNPAISLGRCGQPALEGIKRVENTSEGQKCTKYLIWLACCYYCGYYCGCSNAVWTRSTGRGHAAGTRFGDIVCVCVWHAPCFESAKLSLARWGLCREFQPLHFVVQVLKLEIFLLTTEENLPIRLLANQTRKKRAHTHTH